MLTEDSYKQYVEAWNTKDVPKILEFHAPECVYEDVAFSVNVVGLEQLEMFVAGVFDSIPDFNLEVISYQCTEAMSASEWVMSGTQNGMKFKTKGSTIMEVQNGKLLRNSDYHNLGGAI